MRVIALRWSSGNGSAVRARISRACRSKNVIYSSKVASLARRGGEFGLGMDQLRINMAGVQQRKRKMVEAEH